MREIKFRAWDWSMKNMLDWEYLRNKQATFFNSDWFYVMQYTGLKDKNGKEIYEGDVLHDVAGNGGDVNWCENMWVIGASWPMDAKDCAELYEVIGNIYENPELIK